MGQGKASVLQQKQQRVFFPMWSLDHSILLYRVNIQCGMKSNLCFPIIAGQRLVSAFFFFFLMIWPPVNPSVFWVC